MESKTNYSDEYLSQIKLMSKYLDKDEYISRLEDDIKVLKEELEYYKRLHEKTI